MTLDCHQTQARAAVLLTVSTKGCTAFIKSQNEKITARGRPCVAERLPVTPDLSCVAL